MALDSRYVIAPNWQWYFVNKDTGLPLSAGVIYFYSDVNRTTPKNVYELTGTAPNYTYTALPNPLTLSSVGTIVDGSGNQITPYFLPQVSLSDPTVENYYIKVYSAGGITSGVLQQTIEAFPNATSGAAPDDTTQVTNYIPNGQFLAHNNIPATDTAAAGTISAAETAIAQGGWFFERSAGATTTETVKFYQFNSYLTNPTGSPQYYCRVTASNTGSATYKYLEIRWPNVNKFASAANHFNFSVTGTNNAGGNVTLSVVQIRYYGAGGSATDIDTVGSFTFGNSYAITSVDVGPIDNTGKTIGSGGDDYYALAISFSVGIAYDISLTDAVFKFGASAPTVFPVTPDDVFFSQGVAGYMPTPAADGSDLGLPLVLTKLGVGFDDSRIGSIFGAPDASTPAWTLPCDGQGYDVERSSPEGIPYSRLFAKWYNSTYKICNTGTGYNYFQAYTSTLATDNLMIVVNGAGNAAIAANGTPSPTFTVAQIHVGETTTIAYAYHAQDARVMIQSTVVYSASTYSAGTTTGFTFTTIKGVYSPAPGGSNPQAQIDATAPLTFIVTAPAPASITGGHYFTFTCGSATASKYYVWFKKDTVGVNPAPAGFTGIEVDILSTWSATDVAVAIANSINGSTSTSVICVGGSSVPAGSYFTITTNTEGWYVWYEVSSSGTDPAVVNKKPIKCAILTGDTAAQVAAKTMLAINSRFVGTPDLRGVYLKGADAGSGNDQNTAYRFSPANAINGITAGTFQTDQIYGHHHGYDFPQETTVGAAPGATIYGNSFYSIQSAATGQAQTEVPNFYVNWYVYY